MSSENPELARSVQTGNFKTNYHDVGAGENVFLIHGSGPGVTAWANWRLTIPALSDRFRVIAPDMSGFGYTERPDGIEYNMDTWVQHAIDLLDALDIQKTHLVGNSFGGALALALTIRYPERVEKLVLMGSVGVHFELTPGLDKVWGYEPSIKNMRGLLDTFAFNRELVSDELAELRYKASVQPGFQEAFSRMFPAPRQRWIKSMQSAEEDIQNIKQKTLIIHGAEDQVIPVSTSEQFFRLIENSELHLFRNCGHWTQIEHKERFNTLISSFFSSGP
jgi:2-hydroxymuconate-semialdehyde hydrolase